MFKSLALAAVVLAGGAIFTTTSVDAGPPYRGQRNGGYRSFRPVVVTPYVVQRQVYSYGRNRGFSGQRYPAYRPSIGIGGYPGYGYNGFGNPGFGNTGFGNPGFGGYGGYGGYNGFGGYRGFGGPGISLYLGR